MYTYFLIEGCPSARVGLVTITLSLIAAIPRSVKPHGMCLYA